MFGLIGGEAANQPKHKYSQLRSCHSERSEESPNFNRTPMILNVINF